MILHGIGRVRHTLRYVAVIRATTIRNRGVDADNGRSKLRRMKLLRRIPVVVALTLAAACERAKSPPRADSATIRPAGNTDSAVAAPGSSWNVSAGPVLLVAGEEPSQAFVVVPDAATADATLSSIPHPADVTLFSRSGTVQTAELPDVARGSVCPTTTLSAAPPPRPWNVGFIGGVVLPLPVDSIESIPPADSAALVVWMNRLASALPNDSTGRFAGLPFVVRSLWRFKLPSGTPVVVSGLTRQINQEASPLQEYTFLVTEQAAADSSYATAYSERISGAEETIQNTDILSGALLGSGRTPTLIVARDFGDATAYAFIERGSDGRWRARWTSSRRHC